MPGVGAVQLRSETRRRVKPRQAQPVDRPVLLTSAAVCRSPGRSAGDEQDETLNGHTRTAGHARSAIMAVPNAAGTYGSPPAASVVVNVAAMSKGHHDDEENIVVNRIDDPVVANPNA